MKCIVNSIISVILAISMVLCTNLINVNAQEKSTQLSKGQYLIINSKKNKLGYFEDGVLVKEFSVATGKSSTPTPQGKFKIVNKIKNRPYYSGGIPGGSPNNPLGDRWLGLHVGATYGTTYAIHGNNNASSIGKHVSGGCIRMHNSEIRWLFEQVNVGAYAIIDYSDKTFSQIADKYGVKLESYNELTSNIKNLQSEFKNFSMYEKIDLTNSYNIIDSLEMANSILNSKKSYLNAYNKLNSSEKNHTEVKKINEQYKVIISVVEFAQSTYELFNHVSSNANNLVYNKEWAQLINSFDGVDLGTRGRALKEYNEVISYGEDKKNSNRVAYLDNVYNDAVNFLYCCEFVCNRDISMAISTAEKINDYNLKNIILSVINNFSDIENHWAESDIKEAMNQGWIDNSNKFRPEDSITRVEFIKIVNRKFGFSEKSEIKFSDVEPNEWYYDEVCIAVNHGYINGNPDNTFRPNDKIKREDVAKIITSIMNNIDEEIDKISGYKDYYMVSDWAFPFVEGAIEAGYMGQYSDMFRPKDNITRAESIVTLKRVR